MFKSYYIVCGEYLFLFVVLQQQVDFDKDKKIVYVSLIYIVVYVVYYMYYMQVNYLINKVGYIIYCINKYFIFFFI